MKRIKYYDNSKQKKFYFLQIALTALIIALAVVFNAAVFALAQHNRWYIDMSKGQVFSLSDEASEFLKDIEKDTTKEVDIYFTVEPDEVEAQSPYLYIVYQTALEMEKKFDFINVECIDIVKNPAFFKEYYTTAAQDIKTTSVLVCAGEEFRLFNIESFFINNENGDIWAYQGEYRLVSAILSMTATDRPAVAFTTNHGESVGERAAALMSLFNDAGFEVVNVDLSKEDFPEDTRIVVINDPLYDFAGIEAEKANEIEKIDAFMDSYGTLMVFSSPEKAAALTNISEFLTEWGISFVSDTYVKDTENSLSVDSKTILCAYDENSLGASLYLDIANLDTMPRTVVRNAMPINILWESDSALEGSKDVSPVLLTHDSAVKVDAEGNETAAGGVPVMTVTRETRVENNDYYYSYVLACSSAEYADATWLLSNGYANRDIIYNAMRITGRERVLADIEYKVLDDTSMNITTSEANTWTVVLTVTLPAIIALAGVAVWIRRKNL